MTEQRVVGGLALAAAVVLVSCGDTAAPVPAGARLGAALVAALEAAESTRSPWRCAAPDGPALVEETLAIGDETWKLAGRSVSREGEGAITIGVIADAGGAAPPTLAALGRLRAKLEPADLVVSLGGMGGTQAELEATLGALADRAPWPLVALAGDLEPASAQIAAIAALRARGQNVIDGRLARRIQLPGVTIVTVPGASAESRLAAGADGCGYRASDVAAAFADLLEQPGLRILASAEAPRITVEGEPAGERGLSPGAAQEIDISLHGPVRESATTARSGGRDGKAVALTPGTSDASTRLPGPRNPPTAALLTVNGKAWRWKPITDLD